MSMQYGQAQTVLHQVLSQPVYHVKPAQDPWWMVALKWVAKHLHLHFGPGTFHAVGLVGVCLLAILMVLWVLFAIRRGAFRRSRLDIRTRFDTQQDGTSLLRQATQAYEDGLYPRMLHHLVELFLHLMAAEVPLTSTRSFTLRAYLRQLRKIASARDVQVFENLAFAVERQLYAGQIVVASEAWAILEAVSDWQREVAPA